MAVVVPAADIQGTILQNNINNITTLIANNPLMAVSLNNALLDAQLKLCMYLLSEGSLVPSAVLANETYLNAIASDSGGGG
jgi:hypothetical protein